MEAHHEYRVHAFSAGGRNGVVSAEGVLSCISFSAPPEFLGEPGRWTPEHFLVAAVASCFVSAFSGIAKKSRLEFTTFNLDAEGMLANEDGIWRFTEIKLRPVVTVLKEEDNDLAIRLLEKAKKSCLIARSLQCEVALCADQGRIVRASNSFKQFATPKQSAIVDYTSEAATITATSESQFSRQDRPRSLTSGGSSDR